MQIRTLESRWFWSLQPASTSRVRLYCFPYGGASASAFNEWNAHLPRNVELIAVQLPGRGCRFGEAPLTRAADAINELAREIVPFIDRPYMFFGHSNGALLAYELACRLQSQHRALPQHLIVSGRDAPSQARSEPPIHQLPDEAFIAELKTYGGMPEAVLENRALINVLLPALRADFEMAETYEFTSRAPLRCPITAFAGHNDEWVSEDGLLAWRALTESRFEWKMFEGDHFFIHETLAELLSEIRRIVGVCGSPEALGVTSRTQERARRA